MSLSLYSEYNIYVVNHNYKRTWATVCIQAGCGEEVPGKNGVAHLVEHVCLAYRHAGTALHNNKEYNEAGFQFSGYTNYSQTVLNFTFPSLLENVVRFSGLLKEITSSAIVDEDAFELSKREILQECEEYTAQWKWQQKLISFLTDGQINVLPVGRANEIETIGLQDAASFMKKFYKVENLGLIFFTDIPADEIISILGPANQLRQSNITEGNHRSHEKIPPYNGLSVCDLRHPSGQTIFEIYFRNIYRNVSLKQKVVRMLFEVITKEHVEKYLTDCGYDEKDTSMSVSDKHVTSSFYYAVFTIKFSDNENIYPHIYEEIVHELRQIKFTNETLATTKKYIAAYISDPDQASRQDLMQNILSHFFYGEPIHITHEHYKLMKEVLGQIELEDLVHYSDWILNSPCKVVISSKG